MEKKETNLKKAIASLKKNGVMISKISSVYKTEPIGITNQAWFYNMVVEADTNLNPEELLGVLKNLEKQIGRKLSKRWGPRLIDIDLLLYDDLQLNKRTSFGELKIPHPELKNRAFVLLPLLEIKSSAILPDGSPAKRFLEYTKGQIVKKIGKLGD